MMKEYTYLNYKDEMIQHIVNFQRVGYIRSKPDDRLNKNQRTEFFWPEDQKCKKTEDQKKK